MMMIIFLRCSKDGRDRVNVYQVLWHLGLLSCLNHGHVLNWVGDIKKTF